MKDIIEYLKNPMSKGVYNQVLKINMNGMRDIYKNISEDKEHPGYEGAIIRLENEHMLFDDDMFVENFAECVAGLMYKKPFDEFYNLLDIDPKLIDAETFENEMEYKMTGRDARYYAYLGNAVNVFNKIILRNKLDVIHFDDITERIVYNIIERIVNKKYLKIYEITSIKKETLNLFKKFLEKIPYFNENYEITNKRFTHSSRYVYRLYPYALELWFKDESIMYIPKDLVDLIKAASEYYREEEWRTSVIISAIVIESILADIYEEEKKEDAPDVPLGALFEQVKKIAKIPNEIQSVIGAVNQARIAAVHRSKSPVSDRDADIALYGTTKTIMWFVKNY